MQRGHTAAVPAAPSSLQRCIRSAAKRKFDAFVMTATARRRAADGPAPAVSGALAGRTAAR
jgi:hypothetical protein